MLAPWYAFAFAKLDRIAMRHGYALALHGSMSRDLDLIAIPWTEDADDPEKLLKAIDEWILEKVSIDRKGHKMGQFKATKKPHGRLAYAITVGFDGHWLDLSIMPRISKRKSRRKKK